MKRKMGLYGREILSPEAIERNNIRTVVVAIPVYFTQIESQIRANHEGVDDVIDICWLSDPDWTVEPGRENG